MRLSLVAVAACAATVQAFKDTSSFLLLSSSHSDSLKDASRDRLQTSSSVLETAQTFLESCPSDIYLLIRQPGLSTSELSSHNTPHLHRAIHSSTIQTRYSVPSVAQSPSISQKNAAKSGVSEGVAIKDLLDLIVDKCNNAVIVNQENGAQVMYADLGQTLMDTQSENVAMVVDFDALPLGKAERIEQLADNDARFATIMRTLPEGKSYTIIYTTTPVNAVVREEATLYQPDFVDAVHMDLKRSLIGERSLQNVTQTDFRPLFEKYQFLTPGIFMGLFAGLILLAILSVGINAISSLEVSYAAFDKEMGPSSSKKQ